MAEEWSLVPLGIRSLRVVYALNSDELIFYAATSGPCADQLTLARFFARSPHGV